MAGLLTFPSLLYLPDSWSVALYKQTLLTGITAAGTVPDSHWIPLHQAASATRLKGTNKQAKNQILLEFFLDEGYFIQIICTFAGMKPAFLIAAPTSGSGKTTIARGLMALLVSKGLKVQPFKCGPDYIDTKFHASVCGRPSINLDTFMASPEHVRELFTHYGKDADVCIVEGMMGLFDGYDRDKGSAYEIAKTLDIPVVLVVDAKSAAYSDGSAVAGFIQLPEGHPLCGHYI